MENVDLFAVVFNSDTNSFEKDIHRGVAVKDYDEYNNNIQVSGVDGFCKLNSVVITERAGYLVTSSKLSDTDGIAKVVQAFKDKCKAIIDLESSKLKFLNCIAG